MTRPTPIRRVHGQVTADSSTLSTKLISEWVLAFGASKLRLTDAMRARSGDLTTKVRYRFAQARTGRPGAWDDALTTRDANGSGTQDIDISSITDQLWVQVGLAAAADVDAAEGFCTLEGSADSGEILAILDLDLQPLVNTGDARYVSLGSLQPALGLSRLMFAAIAYGVDGTLTLQPAWRLFASDGSEPAPWVDLATPLTTTSAVDHNWGTLAVSPGSPMAFQPGLKISGSDARGNVQVIVAGSWG